MPAVVEADVTTPVLIVPTIQERIARDFSPRMVKVVACESRFKHWDSKGNVLKSPTQDYGRFQINWSNIPTAKKLGYDVMTEEGNYDFALWLYNKYGISQWSCNRMV